MLIELDGPAERWQARDGKSAPCLARWDGLPSYETDDGRILVYDSVWVHAQVASVRASGGMADLGTSLLLSSRSYGEACFLSTVVGEHELVALHHDPDALWQWRPILHSLSTSGRMQRLGSQQELGWRWGQGEVLRRKAELEGRLQDVFQGCLDESASGEEFVRRYRLACDQARAQTTDYELARDRAAIVLREHLSPLQRIDLEAWGWFFCRGTANPLYQVYPGHGVWIVDPETRAARVTVCIHPEHWIPDDDIALACKMLIESGVEGEEELLAGGRSTVIPRKRTEKPATALERRAWHMEREMLPAAA